MKARVTIAALAATDVLADPEAPGSLLGPFPAHKHDFHAGHLGKAQELGERGQPSSHWNQRCFRRLIINQSLLSDPQPLEAGVCHPQRAGERVDSATPPPLGQIPPPFLGLSFLISTRDLAFFSFSFFFLILFLDRQSGQ